jgi:RNA polymerase sigma-70 factor (ECF subfamily)
MPDQHSLGEDRVGQDRWDPADAASDAVLGAAVARAQDGDEDAFRHVYRAVQPRLLNFVRALVGEADAEDVASETWSRIARDLRSFRGDADGFRGWAATIARHRATDHLRRRRPGISLPLDEFPHRAAGNDTERDAVEGISTASALALIAELPPDQAQAILLRVVIGLDAKSAGQILGKRPGAVRTAAHRGLRHLAGRLRPSGGKTDEDHDGRSGSSAVTAFPSQCLREVT